MGDLSVSGSYYHQTRESLTEPLSPLVQKPYGLADFSLDWDNVLDGGIDVSVYVKNAFDKLYFNGFGVSTFNAVLRAEPRTYGMQVRYHLGGHP